MKYDSRYQQKKLIWFIFLKVSLLCMGMILCAVRINQNAVFVNLCRANVKIKEKNKSKKTLDLFYLVATMNMVKHYRNITEQQESFLNLEGTIRKCLEDYRY